MESEGEGIKHCPIAQNVQLPPGLLVPAATGESFPEQADNAAPVIQSYKSTGFTRRKVAL